MNEFPNYNSIYYNINLIYRRKFVYRMFEQVDEQE